MLAFAFSQNCWGQSFSIVGIGSANSDAGSATATIFHGPFGNFYWGVKNQFFVTAAQLTAAGIPAGANMSSLGFNVVTDNGTTVHTGFNIKVFSTTSTNAISAAYVTSTLLGSTTATNVNVVTGWNMFNFTTPFTWNGTDNLVIETCFNNSSYTSNAIVRCTNSGLGTAIWSRWNRTDNSTVCSSTSSTSTSGTTRPDMQFGWNRACATNTVNFNDMGPLATAALPGGWRMGTDWSTGIGATTLAAGTTSTGALTSSSTGGFYNFANGITASSTDRAIGFLNTGTYTSPRSIIYAFTNNTGATVTSLDLSWNYEKYKSGVRAWDWTFFHGNTSTAATANTSGNQSYAADANNTTVSNPPASIGKSFSITGLNIANGTTYYLRWTLTGSGGSTNGQALGIDDFTIKPNASSVGGTASSNQSICSGTSPANITLAGNTGNIQWQVSTDNITFNNIAGATASPLTSAQMGTLTATRYYRALVTLGSCAAVNSSTVTVTVNALPTAPVVGTITHPTCATATGSVALSGLPASGTWTVTATGGSSITVTGTTASFSGLAAGTYTFTVTNSNNCTSAASGNAVVNAQPVTPSAPTVGTITQPTCSTATGSVALSGLPAGSWTVTASPGGSTLTGSTTTTDTFTGLAASTTYNFTVSNGTCTSAASSNAIVNAQPTTSAAPTLSSPICSGATTVSGTGVNGSAIKIIRSGLEIQSGSATWSGTSYTITVSSVSAFQSLTATQTETGKCVSAASSAVTVSNCPSVSASGTLSAFSACANIASTEQTFTVSGLSLSANLIVTAPTGFQVSTSSGTGFASSVSLAPSGGTVASTTIYVRMSAQASSPASGNITCASTGATTQNVAVSGTVNPNAAITSVTGTSPLCISGTATYSANGVNLGGGGTGAWSSSNTSVATVNSSTGVVTAVAAGTCNIVYTITGGCGGTVSQLQSLTVNSNAAVTSVTGTTPLCISGTATYTANGVNLGSTGTGAWSSSNTAVATVNSSTGVVTAVAAGTCNIVYTITGGCGGTVSQQQSLTVNANNTITLSSAVGTNAQTLTGGNAITNITYTTTGATGATFSGLPSGVTGSWSANTVTISGTPTQGGTFNYTVTMTGGCTGGTNTATGSITVLSSFRSATTGNWNSNSTWETSVDGTTWAAATYTPTSSEGTITIQNGHNVTVNASVTADELTVASTGTLTVASTQTLTIANGTGTDLTVNGTLNNLGTITQSSSTMSVGTAGTYIHAVNGGTIPTATWSSGSTLNVTGMAGTAPTGMGQNFHHVTWNCASQSVDVNINSSPTWGGNLTVSSTGASNKLSVSSGAGSHTLTVSGNVSITGGTLTLNTGATSGGGSLSVTGNMSVSGTGKFFCQSANWGGTLTVSGNLTTSGTATFQGAETNYNSNSVMNLYGNIDIATGTVGARNGTTNNGFTTINLYGSGKTLNLPTTSRVWNNNAYWNINFKNGSSTTLNSDVYSGLTVTVETGATLNMGTYVIASMTSSSNSFVTQASSIVKTANTNGFVAAGTNSGSVQTATRTLNGGATYEYNGTLAQNTGTGLPASISGTLKINNAAGVTLTQATTITGTVTFTSGILTTTTANYLFVSTGSMTGYGASSYVFGPVRRQFTQTASPYTGNDYFFPIGDASNYRPFELNSVNCTTGAQAQVSVSLSGASTVDGSLLSVASRNWFLDWVNPSAALTSATVRITESGLTSSSEIGRSSAQSGNYTSEGGASIGSTISSAAAVSISSTDMYFAIGISCVGPTSQATAINITNLGSTTLTLNWTRGNGAGVIVVASTSATMTDPTNGTTYTGNAAFGSAPVLGSGKVVYSGTGTSVNITGLTSGTTYYFAIYEYTSGCYNKTELTGSVATYCTYAGSNTYYISSFSTTLGIANITNNNTTTGVTTTGYSDYTSQSVSQYVGGTINFSVASSAYSMGYGIWVDWNNDGTFAAGEQVFVTSSYVNSVTGSITVPLSTSLGNKRMRIVGNYTVTNPSSACSSSANNAEAEDYTFTVISCNQLSGTYSVGTGKTYATITAAVNQLNSCGVSGAVVFELYDATYSASETFPIVINNITGASATNTITFKPASGITSTISGAFASGALIKLNTSDYIIFDGSNNGTTSRNLTITNTSATTPYVIWIGGSSGNVAQFDVIKNCTIINGVITSGTAITLSDNTTLGSSGYFDDITIQNNSIQKSLYTINVYATVASGNGTFLCTQNNVNTSGVNLIAGGGIYVQGADGATISNNTIGNITNSTNTINIYGIWLTTSTINSVISNNTISSLSYTGTGSFAPSGILVTSGVSSSNNVISNNSVSNISSSGSNTTWGIYIGGGGALGGVTVRQNNISNITNSNTSAYPAVGLGLNSSLTTANITAHNNFISNVAAIGYGSLTNWNGYGIWLLGGGGYKLYYNSVNLETNQTSTTGNPAALFIDGAITTANSLDIRNNIFAIPANIGTNEYAILCNASSTVFSNLDYNAYYSATTTFGRIAPTNYSNIATWRTATGKDANSIYQQPYFTSATDLHVPFNANCGLDGKATPISGITTDYDGATRDATTPDIGADEIAYFIAGTASVSPSAICSGATTTLTLSGNSSGTIQWQSSSSGGGSYTNVSGATTTPYTTAALSATTFYRVLLTGSVPGSCAVNTPTVQVTVTAAPSAGTLSGTQAICSNSTVTFTTNGTSGGTWSSGSTGIATVNSSSGLVTPVAEGTATITYLVTGTGGCSNVTATRDVTISAPSVGGSVATNTSVCSATNSTLLTLSGNTGSITKWQSSTNSGSTWSDISNTANTYTATNVAATTIYRAVITSGSCPSANSNTATITFESLTAPTVTNIVSPP